MFVNNDYVVYGKTGVCQVTNIIDGKSMGLPEDKYYELHPVFDSKEKIMAPVGNPKVLIRKIHKKEQILSSIDEAMEQDTVWIDDNKLRKQKFQELLGSGSFKDCIALVKTLYLKNEEKKKNGRKLHMNDEIIMRKSMKILFEEFSVSLGVPIRDVQNFIINKITQNTAVKHA